MKTPHNRVACPTSKTDGENLSHHCSCGSRIQRFIKMWSNFLVIGNHSFVPSQTQTTGVRKYLLK